MVEPANLGDGDDLALATWLGLPQHRSIAVKRQMCARPVIVLEVRSRGAKQMRLIQNDHVVEAFPMDGANDTLGIRVLPRQLRGRNDFFDSHTLDYG